MNDKSWIDEMMSQDANVPEQNVNDEEIYMLKMGDFLHMPVIDFAELAQVDADIRALLN